MHLVAWLAACTRPVWEVSAHPVGSAALTDEVLIVGTADGKAIALDRRTGAERWTTWGAPVRGPGPWLTIDGALHAVDGTGDLVWKAPAIDAVGRALGPVLLAGDGLTQRDATGAVVWWIPRVEAREVITTRTLTAVRVDRAGWWSLFGDAGRPLGVLAAQGAPIVDASEAALAYARADGTFVLLDGAGHEVRVGPGVPVAIGGGHLVVDVGPLEIVRLSDGVSVSRLEAPDRSGEVGLCGDDLVWHHETQRALLASPLSGGREKVLAEGADATLLVCDATSAFWSAGGRVGRTDL